MPKKNTDLRPLEGIVVADFSRVLAGPLSTQMLGDLGARIIKIEEPGRGDETRRWGPPFLGGVSTYFLSVNRNKESLTVDLKSPKGAEIARRLIERVDVVVDNFLPRQKKSLHLTGREILAINPRAVACSIGGYDAKGPEKDRSGYDLLAQAESGLMSITGPEDGDPMKVGVALADVLTAHHAVGAINAALFARERSGEGTSISVSLFGSTVASLVNLAQAVLATGREAERYGNAHASIVPYESFRAKDRAFVVGVGTDRQFAELCRAIAHPELGEDRRYATNGARVKNRVSLKQVLEPIFARGRAQTWVDRCRKRGIPAAVVRGVREALESDEAKSIVATLDHQQLGRLRAVEYPVRFDGRHLGSQLAPPELGQHTDRVLRELGFKAPDIRRLRSEQIV